VSGKKTTIMHRLKASDEIVKVTTTSHVRILAYHSKPKADVEHRNWSKFWDAASGDDTSAWITIVSTEEVFLVFLACTCGPSCVGGFSV
jgi:hypothetical protein